VPREVAGEAPNANPAPQTSPPGNLSGAERRRSPRYACEGSAEIRQEGQDVKTWATFTDISMHGCYVEAAATYPVGTILHLKLEANGFPIFTSGNVRVSYPYLGMGIAFVDMSEENKARLRELLRSISRPMMIMGVGIPASGAAIAPQAAPVGSDPAAVVRALVEYFEERHMLTRDEFWHILGRRRQSAGK
jgi:hypothetical protein